MPDAPRRIQLRRTKGWRMPEGAVSVARPTKWGNRCRVEHVQGIGWCCTDVSTGTSTTAAGPREAHAMAVERHRADVMAQPDLVVAAKRELRGKDLGCWCPESMPCHADVWLEVANG
ncbi:DUF4326 domain-containing protein [Neoroseomonas lacus]|nr:DUF4326 domain-containing protein [Neoroseomonas lacus]